MEITEVRVFPVDEDKLKAYASIVLDRCFIINDLKIIQGKKGLFISMPSRRRKRGGYRDVAHPLNNETRAMVEERVLAEYHAAVAAGTPRVSADAAEDAEPAPGSRLTDRRLRLRPPSPRLPWLRLRWLLRHSHPLRHRHRHRLRHRLPRRPRPRRPAAPAGRRKRRRTAGERSLEEVEELHLRDSFWSVS